VGVPVEEDVGATVGVAVGTHVGKTVNGPVGMVVGVPVGTAIGDVMIDGDALRSYDGLELGITDGTKEGIIDINALGPDDGSELGLPLGTNDGLVLGTDDDILDGDALGSSDGLELGITDGTKEGIIDGIALCSVAVGAPVGADGETVGAGPYFVLQKFVNLFSRLFGQGPILRSSFFISFMVPVKVLLSIRFDTSPISLPKSYNSVVGLSSFSPRCRISFMSPNRIASDFLFFVKTHVPIFVRKSVLLYSEKM